MQGQCRAPLQLLCLSLKRLDQFQSSKGYDECEFEDYSAPAAEQRALMGYFYDRRLLAASFMASDNCADRPELQYELAEENGERCVYLEFGLYYAEGGTGSIPMDENQLLAYLEHGIDWS